VLLISEVLVKGKPDNDGDAVILIESALVADQDRSDDPPDDTWVGFALSDMVGKTTGT
jgi:hypothetical protein